MSADDSRYFSFQGKVYLGQRQSNGKPGVLAWVNDSAVLDIQLQSTVDEKTESYSGNRLVAARVSKGKKANITLELETIGLSGLALALYGSVNTIAPGTVTAEQFPTLVAVGDTIMLDKPGVTNLVITDSTATPKTLVQDTDYRIDSPGNGLVKILGIGTYTQPLKAAYSYAGGINLAMFTQPTPERYLVLDGINTVTNERVRTSLFRVQFDPTDSLPLINDGFAKLTLKGSVLYDTVNASNASLGGFGRMEMPAQT
ncbi:MAG: hypothetical protein ABI171_00695 [Collimonas sp.]|uniref:phage tail tube protein n=1 Tax=Collimonas sp. TaxID=1963772 RepID=UPI00326638CA